MKNLKETKEQIFATTIHISNILKSNEMSAICILYKKQQELVATPAIVVGFPYNIIPAVIKIMQESEEVRNIILTASEYYQFQEKEKANTKEVPPYLKDYIEELIKGL